MVNTSSNSTSHVKTKLKSKRKNVAVGLSLITLGGFLLWWTIVMSRIHAVPIMLGALMILGGVLTLRGFWGATGQGKHSSSKMGREKGKPKKNKRRKH